MKPKIAKHVVLSMAIGLWFFAEAESVHAQEIKSRSASSSNEQILQLQHERDQIKKGKAVAGVVLSTTVGIVGGGALVGTGFAIDVFEERSAAGTALIASGTVLMVVGIVGTVVSAKKLHARRQEIRELDEKIRALEASGERVSVSYGTPQQLTLLRF